MTNPNEPINPTIWDDRHQPNFIRDNDGLTKLEHFSSLAMQGLLSNANGAMTEHGRRAYSPESISMLAVMHAKALIKALNETTA